MVGGGRRFSIDNVKNDQTIKEAFVVIQPTTCAVFLFTNWFFIQQHVCRRIYYLRRRVSLKKEAGSFYCCYTVLKWKDDNHYDCYFHKRFGRKGNGKAAAAFVDSTAFKTAKKCSKRIHAYDLDKLCHKRVDSFDWILMAHLPVKVFFKLLLFKSPQVVFLNMDCRHIYDFTPHC